MSRPQQGHRFKATEDAYIMKNAGKPSDGKLSYGDIAAHLSEAGNDHISQYQVRRRHHKLARAGAAASPRLGVDDFPDEEVDAEKPTWSGDSKTHQAVTFVIELKEVIHNPQELLERAKIQYDKEVWQIADYKIGAWSTPMRTATVRKDENRWESEIGVVQNYKVQVRFTRRPAMNLDYAKRELVESMKSFAPKYPPLPVWRDSGDRNYMLEPCIFDWHFGKLAWGEETGNNYDIDIAEQVMDMAVDDIIARCNSFKFRSVLFPVGQDLLHVDNDENTTAKGTRQDVDTRIKKIAKRGREIVIRQIDKFRQLAPVTVLVIPGNHDHLMTWTLGDSLECWYHNTRHITIDNTPTPRKYHLFGNVLLGYAHGSDESVNDLPGLMAIEQPALWSQAKHRHFHIGHWHKSKETRFLARDTRTGVITRVITSLSGTDAWHSSKGYVGGPKSAEAFIWHKSRGCAAELVSYADPKLYQ